MNGTSVVERHIRDYNMFKEHSWYFRNALVRANYSDIQAGILERVNGKRNGKWEVH